MRCAMTGTPYTVFGYKGKQVRDAIHCHDLIRAFDCVLPRAPRRRGLQHRRRPAFSNCSVLEAIALAEEITGRELQWTLRRRATGSATTSGGSATTAGFRRHYPGWRQEYDVREILRRDLHEANVERWHA